jgi:hypothetical protein
MWKVWYGRRSQIDRRAPFGVDLRQPPTAHAVDEVDPVA